MAYGNYKKKKFPERRDPDVPLTDEERKKLTSQARSLCFYYLGKTDKTRKELKDRLYQKFIPADIIEDTLNELENENYINDSKLANSFVRSQVDYGTLGKRAIEMKLYAKGVSKEEIAEATSVIDMDEEYDKARALVETRLRSTRGLDGKKRYQKLVSFVMRRGYGGDIAYRAVREAIDEEEIEDEEE